MKTCDNKLLNTLSHPDFTTIFKDCELVQLFFGEVVYESDIKIEHIYFPLDCVISLFNEDIDGKAKEIATISNEGATGSEICLNENPPEFLAIATHPGWAYRIQKSSFLDALIKIKKFRFKLLKYAYTFNSQIAFNKSEKDFIKFDNTIINFCYSAELDNVKKRVA